MGQKLIKILCVEDEEDIRENIADILRDEGFEVFEACDGKDGYKKFLDISPDIIISDIMMPEADGYDLLKMVRESENSRKNNIPFIFLTALGQKQDVVKGINLSANDYLIKPIDFELMIAKINEKIANASKVSQQHKKNIDNLKVQMANILPSNIKNYLDIISKTSQILMDEPYGPLPHRKYINDFEKIFKNSNKLRASIENALDDQVIDYRLNVNENILNIKTFFLDFFGSLNKKYSDNIKLDKSVNFDELPKIKCDQLIIHDVFKKIFTTIFSADLKAKILVRVLFDHLDQVVFIFDANFSSKKHKLETLIDETLIGKLLDQQSCLFEVTNNEENTAILTIPSFRVIYN